MPEGWVYIMTDRPNGTLYVAVTNSICRRVADHKAGVVEGFTKRYDLTRVVFVEHHQDILSAIQREKNIKHWPRAWRVRLIGHDNPDWVDLFDSFSF